MKKIQTLRDLNSHGRLNKDELYYIVEYLWEFKSAFSGIPSSQKDGLLVGRWDINKPLALDNAVPMLVSELQKHYKGELNWTAEQKQFVQQNLKQSVQEIE